MSADELSLAWREAGEAAFELWKLSGAEWGHDYRCPRDRQGKEESDCVCGWDRFEAAMVRLDDLGATA